MCIIYFIYWDSIVWYMYEIHEVWNLKVYSFKSILGDPWTPGKESLPCTSHFWTFLLCVQDAYAERNIHSLLVPFIPCEEKYCHFSFPFRILHLKDQPSKVYMIIETLISCTWMERPIYFVIPSLNWATLVVFSTPCHFPSTTPLPEKLHTCLFSACPTASSSFSWTRYVQTLGEWRHRLQIGQRVCGCQVQNVGWNCPKPQSTHCTMRIDSRSCNSNVYVIERLPHSLPLSLSDFHLLSAI